jgi:quercetin dioxygenase-like cupin family protein
MSSAVRHARWEDIPKERVTDTIHRRLFTGDRMMIAHVYLDKGAIVPTHQHENEQLTYIIEGALHFWIGATSGSEPKTTRAGRSSSYAPGKSSTSRPTCPTWPRR